MAEGMKRLFLEPDELGLWHKAPGEVHAQWQDLGLGLLVTIAKEAGFEFDTLSLKGLHSWAEWRTIVRGRNYDLICMNVRSWRFPWAVKAARIAKAANPSCQIWVGGFHATVAEQEMTAVNAFDRVVSGEGEAIFLLMLGAKPFLKLALDDLPFINREVMPKGTYSWPLEGPAGWAEGRTATIITGRGCPFACAFCASEKRHFGPPRRRSVDNVLEELAYIDRKWGPIGSVIFHDSLFFMNRKWLEEFADKYPRKGGWPFWAAARSDLMHRWSDLAKDLILNSNWRAVSVGFESGSENVLGILQKGITVADNEAVVELLNGIGDDMQREGRLRPLIYGNFMLAVPGETYQDALDTMNLAGKIKDGILNLNVYAPYPGTPLGDRIRAEGNAIEACADFMARKPKVKGVDYEFYRKLLNKEEWQ